MIRFDSGLCSGTNDQLSRQGVVFQLALMIVEKYYFLKNGKLFTQSNMIKIDHRNIENLSVGEFKEKYGKNGIAVVITGLKDAMIQGE